MATVLNEEMVQQAEYVAGVIWLHKKKALVSVLSYFHRQTTVISV